MSGRMKLIQKNTRTGVETPVRVVLHLKVVGPFNDKCLVYLAGIDFSREGAS